MAKNENLTTELRMDSSQFKKELSKIKSDVSKLSGDLRSLGQGKVKIDTSGIDTAKKQIEDLKAEVKSISGTVKVKTDVGTVGGTGEAGGGGGGFLGKIGKGAIGAGVAVLPGVGVIKGFGRAEALSQLREQLGVTDKIAEEYIRDINAVSIKTNSSFEQASKTFIEMRRAGVVDIQKNAEYSLALQKMYEEDSKDITKAVRSITSEFGVSGTKAQAGLNVVLREIGNLDGETVDAFWEYSTQLKTLGYSFEESLSLAISSAKAGIFTLDKSFDFLKEGNLRMNEILTSELSGAQTEALSKLNVKPEELSKIKTSGEALGLLRKKVINNQLELNDTQLKFFTEQILGTQLEDIGGFRKWLQLDEAAIAFDQDWDKIVQTETLDKAFNNIATVVGAVPETLDAAFGSVADAIERGGRSLFGDLGFFASSDQQTGKGYTVVNNNYNSSMTSTEFERKQNLVTEQVASEQK